MRKSKILVVLSLVLSVAILGGCAHTTSGVGKTSVSPVLDRILDREELVVGMAGNMPPLNMTTKEGEIIGLEPELARYMAAGMGVGLRIETMPFAELLPALLEEKIDMILSGMTITPERNLGVAFVGPYYVTGKAFLTKIETIASAEEPSEVDTPDITLVALAGSTSEYFAEDAIPRAKLVTAESYDEAVKMVMQGKADAMIADYEICAVSVLRYPEQGFVSIFTRLTYEPIGIALPAGDPHLINWLENFLGNLDGSGRLEVLAESWLEDGSWLERLPGPQKQGE
ncbi:MAG: transporter substrate-binding domain-containing protein [Deltaproteobacteria bacterium]|nr:transporter substrate-binding domain-containing protein [Deltaproteobacteria bacterium]NIS76245.1 transporter substrate-binding domain-containing protein [Deltaproteobacteria bacterium]